MAAHLRQHERIHDEGDAIGKAGMQVDRSIIGRPFTGASNLGSVPPSREPVPAAA